jgi:RNA polymerase sigma-70 factor (ECF subfamily)
MDEVKTALADLPHSVRDIMLLKYFEDMTFEEIAEIVSLPVNTVKSHFYRGKQKIYSLIKR